MHGLIPRPPRLLEPQPMLGKLYKLRLPNTTVDEEFPREVGRLKARGVRGKGLVSKAVSPGVGAGSGVSRTAPSGHLECLKKRMRVVKEIVVSRYYRFYPPILVFDLALTTPIPDGECKIVADILLSEFEKYGAYLAFLYYLFNAPYDIIEGDFNKNVETLKILRYTWELTG